MLAAHPDARAKLEEGRRESEEEREHCLLVAREINGFVVRGIPSRFGLIISLGSPLGNLRDIRADMDEETKRRWRERVTISSARCRSYRK